MQLRGLALVCVCVIKYEILGHVPLERQEKITHLIYYEQTSLGHGYVDIKNMWKPKKHCVMPLSHDSIVQPIVFGQKSPLKLYKSLGFYGIENLPPTYSSGLLGCRRR